MSKSKTKPAPESSYAQFLLPDEDPEDFDQFHQRLIDDPDPQSTLEDRLVEGIAFVELEIDRHRRLPAATLTGDIARMELGTAGFRRPTLAAEMLGHHKGRDLWADNAFDDDDDDVEQDTDGLDEARSQRVAEAYHLRQVSMAYHESAIADLEARRRKLLTELNWLQQKYAAKAQSNKGKATA